MKFQQQFTAKRCMGADLHARKRVLFTLFFKNITLPFQRSPCKRDDGSLGNKSSIFKNSLSKPLVNSDEKFPIESCGIIL